MQFWGVRCIIFYYLVVCCVRVFIFGFRFCKCQEQICRFLYVYRNIQFQFVFYISGIIIYVLFFNLYFLFNNMILRFFQSVYIDLFYLKIQYIVFFRIVRVFFKLFLMRKEVFYVYEMSDVEKMELIESWVEVSLVVGVIFFLLIIYIFCFRVWCFYNQRLSFLEGSLVVWSGR